MSGHGETRRLGAGCKLVLLLMSACTASLVVAGFIAMRVEQEKCDRTLLLFRRFATVVGSRPGNRCFVPPPRPSKGDPTGQLAIRTRFFSSFDYRNSFRPPRDEELDQRADTPWKQFVETLRGGTLALDAWGNPIYYRCPGPIHKNGWDLISCGPNGIYEEGQGDDMVAGEDLPGGLASIDSNSTASVTGESK